MYIKFFLMFFSYINDATQVVASFSDKKQNDVVIFLSCNAYHRDGTIFFAAAKNKINKVEIMISDLCV